MNRIKFFQDARMHCEDALSKSPDMLPLEWVIAQLNYLIDVEKGNIKDTSALLEIKIAWIAVREMDGYEDKDLIHKLCVVSDEVEKMIAEKKLIK